MLEVLLRFTRNPRKASSAQELWHHPTVPTVPFPCAGEPRDLSGLNNWEMSPGFVKGKSLVRGVGVPGTQGVLAAPPLLAEGAAEKELKPADSPY